MALPEADGGADRAQRPRVAKLVPGEGQRVQSGNLCFDLAALPSHTQRPLSEPRGGGRVGLDERVRVLGQRKRVVLNDLVEHPGHVSRLSQRALHVHTIFVRARAPRERTWKWLSTKFSRPT